MGPSAAQWTRPAQTRQSPDQEAMHQDDRTAITRCSPPAPPLPPPPVEGFFLHTTYSKRAFFRNWRLKASPTRERQLATALGLPSFRLSSHVLQPVVSHKYFPSILRLRPTSDVGASTDRLFEVVCTFTSIQPRSIRLWNVHPRLVKDG